MVEPDARYSGPVTANSFVHGTAVASKFIGRSLGLCTKAELLLVHSELGGLSEQDLLVPLVAVLEVVTT